MAILIQNISLPFTSTKADVFDYIANKLSLDDQVAYRLHKVSIDARKKRSIKKIFQVVVTVNNANNEAAILAQTGHGLQIGSYTPPASPTILKRKVGHSTVVVGMGPAGLFAALLLAKSGTAVTIIERGEEVEKRVHSINTFWSGGQLNPESNVQFGEGGAGTFSDGKLTTRKNHPWSNFVIETLIEHGAPESIRLQAKPHVGTDKLRSILIGIRRTLINLGVQIKFSTRMDDLIIDDQRVKGVITSTGEEILADQTILAIGHSARDSYRLLHQKSIQLSAKSFAVGVRIEHPRQLINKIQYGMEEHPALPTAEYSLAWNDPETGRGIYSFCMCPGGLVVNASSAPEMLVVNGMSYADRAGDYSNSALVVSVRPEDFGSHPLDGISFQEDLERRAFQSGGSNYFAPSQNLLEFLGKGRGVVKSSVTPGFVESDLRQLLPDWTVQGIERAMPIFDRKMRGFLTAEATLTAVETRTSAPLRIERDKSGESVSHQGLYPTGEGAGYAGGIMSAAIDGLTIANNILTNASQES